MLLKEENAQQISSPPCTQRESKLSLPVLEPQQVSMVLWLSLGATAITSVIYLACLQQGDKSGQGTYVLAGLKILPILCLMGGVTLSNRHGRRRAIQLVPSSYAGLIRRGLLFSLVGDILLELETLYPPLFIGGLASFLWAHVCYIRAFKGDVGPLRLTDPIMQATTLAFSVYGVVLLRFFLLPNVEAPLLLPVCLYTIVISMMGILAVHRFCSSSSSSSASVPALATPSNWAAMFGALVFVASDSILGLDRFHHPLPHGKIVVMLTYYVGQASIAASSSLADQEDKQY